MRFIAPVGNLRRASWSIYVGVFAVLVGSLLIVGFVPGGDRLAIVVIIAALWLAVLLVNDLLGTANRMLARRLLARRPCATMADLAAICWLRSLVGPRSDSRFDAAEWIRRTGPDGPRVVCREFRLAAVPPDPNATEEEAILPWLEESRVRRANLWVGAAIWAAIAGWSGHRAIVSGSAGAAVVAGVAMMLLVLRLRRLGVLGRELAPISISPEGLRVLQRAGTIVFTRADSVLMIEPRGTSSSAWLHWVRIDGKCADVQVSIEPQAKTLSIVLSRWCWRGGAGAAAMGFQLRNHEPVPTGDPGTAPGQPT